MMIRWRERRVELRHVVGELHEQLGAGLHITFSNPWEMHPDAPGARVLQTAIVRNGSPIDTRPTPPGKVLAICRVAGEGRCKGQMSMYLSTLAL